MRTETQTNDTLSYANIPVLHLFSQFHTIGGVESVLHLHRESDRAIGVKSDFIIYNEEPKRSSSDLHCLGITGTDSIARLGSKLQSVTSDRRNRLAIYHLPWGFPFFCPFDFSSRRILTLHGHFPGLERFLRRNARYLDGILCVNPELRASVLAALPQFPPDRISVVGYPIRPPPQQRHCEDLSRPVQLGFIGRLQIEQKRIDRIPPFCSELSKYGVPFNLSVLGAGQERELLESNCGSHPITLTGALQGDAYWHEIRAMDFLVFFSDYEGTPIAMLEAMSQGVIPIYPSIGTGGDAYVARISPDLLYPPGDVAAAAAIVKRLSETESGYIHKLRGRARETVRHHSPKNYLKGVFDFAKTTNDGSRISSSSAPASVKFLRFLTLKQSERLAAIARRLAKFS